MTAKRTRNLRGAHSSDVESDWDGAVFEFSNGKETFRIHLDWYSVANLGGRMQLALTRLKSMSDSRKRAIGEYIKNKE